MSVAQLLEVHTNLLKDFLSDIEERSTLSENAEPLQQTLQKYGAIVLAEIAEALSTEFRENHELRKTLGLRVKERRRTKIVYTVLGNVELRNDIYEDTAHDSGSKRRCLSPVLESLGVNPHQKITDGVQRRFVTRLRTNLAQGLALEQRIPLAAHVAREISCCPDIVPCSR